jgi:hypothetical protein
MILELRTESQLTGFDPSSSDIFATGNNTNNGTFDSGAGDTGGGGIVGGGTGGVVLSIEIRILVR